MTPAPIAADMKTEQHELRCGACGEWVVTVPATWARGRCVNRRCRLFKKQQTMFAGHAAMASCEEAAHPVD